MKLPVLALLPLIFISSPIAKAQIGDPIELLLPSFCGPGTYWDDQQQKCVVLFPADVNIDGCVTVNDILSLLTSFTQCISDPSYPGTIENSCFGQTAIQHFGEEYSLIPIGDQCWIRENLKTTQFRNGDDITDVTGSCSWHSQNGPARKSYNNNPTISETHGFLYNWEAIADERGLCPNGFRIPTKGEFQSLASVYGTNANAGGALKSTETWNAPNAGGTNVSTFSALASGMQVAICNSPSSGLGQKSHMWTSSNFNSSLCWSFELDYFSTESEFVPIPFASGISVRCIKDAVVPGCTDSNYFDFNPGANLDDGSCSQPIIPGCTNAEASNFSAEANFDDGSCQDIGPCHGADIIAYDNHDYAIAAIGDRCWFTENLQADNYSNGEAIPFVTGSCTWQSYTTGAFRVYGNDLARKEQYGLLYNYHATQDARGLCPDGWSVPTIGEWQSLIETAGGDSIAGGNLKATDTWTFPNTGATDTLGFSALPGGYNVQGCNAPFIELNTSGWWWSTSPFDEYLAWSVELHKQFQEADQVPIGTQTGISVRCIKDAVVPGCTDSNYFDFNPGANLDDGSCSQPIIPGCTNAEASNFSAEANFDDGSCQDIGPCHGADIIAYDNHDYAIAAIGDRCWFTENLQADNYSNGEAIPFVTGSCTWQSYTTGAFRVYGNDLARKEQYGLLYNYHATQDARGLCPDGWSVPTIGEWQSLIETAGGDSIAGGNLKATDTWTFPNTGATDTLGFSALPGGYNVQGCNAPFIELNTSGWWWSTSLDDDNQGLTLHLFYDSGEASLEAMGTQSGLSVRCVKD